MYRLYYQDSFSKFREKREEEDDGDDCQGNAAGTQVVYLLASHVAVAVLPRPKYNCAHRCYLHDLDIQV